MKGKRGFTKKEIDLIKSLIRKKLLASTNEQKKIRNKIRSIGFYFSDFSSKKGYTVEDVEKLIEKGEIIIKVQASTLNKKLSFSSNDKKEVSQEKIKSKTLFDIEANLILNANFRLARNIDSEVLDKTGFYCIRLSNNSYLPERYQSILDKRKHRIIYIGKAEGQPLSERFLNQELRAIGHGTFFRSIGTVLGFKPPKGSLKGKTNQNNYKFSKSDEKKIIEWINSNLEVNWIVYEGSFSIEEEIIKKYTPLLNYNHNPMRLKELKEDKDECRRMARE